MVFRNLSLSFLLMVALLTSVSLPINAQQTVDPSGTCSTSSHEITVNAPTGTFFCQPSALGSSTGTWQKMTHGINTVAYTINYNTAALIGTAGLTKDINLITLPAGATVLHARIKPMVAFTGTATLTASIGDSTSNTAFTATVDCNAAVSNTAFIANTAPKITTEAADTIFVHFIATTNNLTLLTAGQLKATITYILPAAGATVIASAAPQHEWQLVTRYAVPERRQTFKTYMPVSWV